MSTVHWFILVLALSACTGKDAPPGTIDAFELTSAFTNQTYGIEVFTPDALDTVQDAPIVYIFDGPENQATVLDSYKTALDRGIEPALLVLVPGTNRIEDFTPTPNERGTNGGGQVEFIRFITEELAPEVEADGAGGAPERRITFGHSLGGLLSATMWYDHPFATRAGIASPSLWWDDGLFFAKVDEAPTNQGPIVVACGEEEPMGMFVYTADFAQWMRDDYGIDAVHTCFDNRYHSNAYGPALTLTFQELL